MSLKFTFNPPKGVRFVRWQKITFTASKPFIHFCLHDTHDKLENKPILRSRSFADWHAYLQALHKKGIYSELFNAHKLPIKGPPIVDFSQILDNISEGYYTDVEQVKEDIDKCLISINEKIVTSDNLNSSIVNNYRDAAYYAKLDIDQSYNSSKESRNLPSARLIKSLEEFKSLESPRINDHKGTEFNIDKFAEFLNHKSPTDKLKIEWIIRMKSPRVNFATREIDLNDLPLDTIRTLADYFQYKM
ncbi:hypothetical protein TVAG_411450 [Trichomonas vaginalis G3]|uniref:Uncharacterized protein n=1 Tax=Trichomonas vaginalis (strain ATCC PRA-98 / G3) TaxID=412133 RepID=A2DXQ0_TRIV3|nr:hypothetical protein TVAGG3_0047440 [Trichomonas vaginalis G3]EAY14879.1 hypothetical protein TVAG_411450 [Trichomonas vaginalis G3]KAI5541139.1 hypothetical protein TVAGG3_0047440 [Trichomonas vaginalis G3]|eukprot:XP_001327102.1 hypothetical protein [Trichomonas vaginalis G3]